MPSALARPIVLAMGEPKPKYLIETSAVLAATGFSSGPHSAHFDEQTADGELCTSFYVRKETLRRWVCDIIAFAQMVDMSSRVSDALTWWADEYGRKPKLLGQLIGAALRDKLNLSDDNTRGAAVEIAQIALDLIEIFDVKLVSRTRNTAGCRIGGSEVDVDGNRLLTDLSSFRDEFLKEVEDCPVNEFLQFRTPKGRTAKLLGCESMKARGKAACESLQVLYEGRAHISCVQCAKIGDPVIAMEQPGNTTLVHIDRSFDDLCECTGRNHKKIRSNASFKPKGTAGPAAREAGN